MKRLYLLATLTTLVPLSNIFAVDPSPKTPSKMTIQSVYTKLDRGSCTKEIDHTDPNDTPFLRCPGVAGYTLILRLVDSGRESIEVVDPAQQMFPLNYQEVVTRHMFSTGDKAEWRMATIQGKETPIALIVRLHVHGSGKNPEKVTRIYHTVAKITATEACVTDRVLTEAAARTAADTAAKRPCLPSLQ